MRQLTNDQKREWLSAFIVLWENAHPSSDNDFTGDDITLDFLTDIYQRWCSSNVPSHIPMSADELLCELAE